MVKRNHLILVGMGVALAAVLAWAQDQSGMGQTSMGTHGWSKSTDLAGKEVRDAQNNKIGDVKTLVIEMGTGRCLFAILPGSYVDKRDQDIAVPFTALRLTDDAKHLVLSTDKNQLASAPSFNERNWPNMTDPAFVSKVYTHFNARMIGGSGGMEPARQAGAIEREREEAPNR